MFEKMKHAFVIQTLPSHGCRKKVTHMEEFSKDI